jgi:hypothetical protein
MRPVLLWGFRRREGHQRQEQARPTKIGEQRPGTFGSLLPWRLALGLDWPPMTRKPA